MSTSSVAGNEPYRITIALNGYVPLKAECSAAVAKVTVRRDNPGLADLILVTDKNTDASWVIYFSGSR
jgi:hypothetical protein